MEKLELDDELKKAVESHEKICYGRLSEVICPLMKKIVEHCKDRIFHYDESGVQIGLRLSGLTTYYILI